jgi:release factor glutamine methyltransferase
VPEADSNPCSINDLLVDASAQLKHSSDTPALDAQVLLAHTLDHTRTWLMAHATELLSNNKLETFRHLIEQRSAGTPIAHLTGLQEFWSLPLQVTGDTLIPRPETELLVELALERIPIKAPCTVADIGTGSGAIALAIASEREHCQIVATDISAAALEIARNNATTNGLRNVSFCIGANLEPVEGRQFDLIVSNPPYIASDDPHLLQGDVRFEPRTALVAGEDGLDVIRALVRHGAGYLKPDGWLIIEHGYDQEHAIVSLFEQAGFTSIECYRDLAGQPRVTIGQVTSS